MLPHSDIDPSNRQQTFDFAQLTFKSKAKPRVIDKLITMSTIEAFISDVVDVEKKLHQGQISSIRQLELELVFNAKVCYVLLVFIISLSQLIKVHVTDLDIAFIPISNG